MTDVHSVAWCADCDYRLPDIALALATPAPPCPECGGDAKRVEVLAQETVVVAIDEVRGLGYGVSKARWLVKFYNRREFFKLTGRWHAVQRTFDMRADRYVEHITDAETGQLVRYADEPLSQHQGRGSARHGRRGGTGGTHP